MRSKQLKLLASEPSAYGGELLKTRKGRRRGRPLAVKSSMHLVLRSSRATGDRSFNRTRNRKKIEAILKKFALKNSIQLLSVANVGNHLHLHVQLRNRFTYKPFIRAVTSAIAMAITGRNRWTTATTKAIRFWDYRPFTRIVMGLKDLLGLKDYIQINQLEGFGCRRETAEFLVRRRWRNTA